MSSYNNLQKNTFGVETISLLLEILLFLPVTQPLLYVIFKVMAEQVQVIITDERCQPETICDFSKIDFLQLLSLFALFRTIQWKTKSFFVFVTIILLLKNYLHMSGICFIYSIINL